MDRVDTCYVTKVDDTGNKGHKEVTYTVAVDEADGTLECISFRQLEELAEFLYTYVKQEKEKQEEKNSRRI